MYVHFTNPFKSELKLALLNIYYSRIEDIGTDTIMYGIAVTILNLTISHDWVRDKK